MAIFCWQHTVFVFDRQLLLAHLISDLEWAYDPKTSLISFGDRIQWRVEILGTESEESGTWLWAWANESSNITVDQEGTSLKLKALGEEHGIAELTEPIVPLAQADGHAFASIAVGEGLGKAYFRAPYKGGAVLLLITDERLQFDVNEPLQRIVTVFPQAITAMELPDHGVALRNYLEHYKFQVQWDGGALVVRQQDQDLLRAEFDDLGRLIEFKASLGRSSKAIGKSALD